MSALNFSDFERFWTFSFASVISFGLGDIVDELRKMNKKMEKENDQE